MYFELVELYITDMLHNEYIIFVIKIRWISQDCVYRIEFTASPGSSRSFMNMTKEKNSFNYPSLLYTYIAYVSWFWLHFQWSHSVRYCEKLQKNVITLKKNTISKSLQKLLPSTGWHFHKLWHPKWKRSHKIISGCSIPVPDLYG